MFCFNSIAIAACLLASVSGLPQGSYSGASKKALYFLQNNPAGSSLLALDVTNGQAAKPVRVSTGGVGSAVVNATTHQPMMPYTLQSQGAVAVGGDYVFTINSGSSTLAMLKIDPANPSHPVMVGQPVDTMGDFPISVAYDNCYRKVCVLNGGAKNNVACWSINDDGLKVDGDARPLNLKLTTPPTVGSGTASQIAFTPDSSHVVVTVKGVTAPATPGSIFVFPVEGGSVGQQPVISSIADIPSDFGFAFGESSSTILVSDPTFGGSVVNIDPTNLQTSEVQHTNSTLKAACWAAYSPVTKMGYTIDAGLPQFGEFDLQSGELKQIIPTDAAFKGAFDTVIDGATAYFIAASPSVGGFDLQQKKTVQNLDLQGVAGVDDRNFWQGIAMWPSS